MRGSRALGALARATAAWSVSISMLTAAAPPLPPFPPLVFDPPKPEILTLENGLKVYLLVNHDLPVIRLDMMFRAAAQDMPADKTGMSEILAASWTQGGTVTRKPPEIARQLERAAASVSFSVSLENSAASMSCRARDFDTVFPIFTELLFKPGFDKEQVELARDQAMEGLRRMNDEPGDISRREFRTLMYGPQHPYARTPTPETLKSISRDDLLRWHESHLAPNESAVAVSGDFDAAAMRERLRTSLGAWPRKTVSHESVAGLAPGTPGRVHYIYRNINQTQIRVGYPAFARHSPDEFPWLVANELWGGGAVSRLFKTVRTRQGLAYSIGSAAFTANQQGFIVVVGQTRGSQAIAATQSILSITKDMRETRFTASELDDAKNSLVNQFVQNFNSPQQIVLARMTNDFFGYPPDHLETYTRRVAAVTPIQVNEVIDRYLVPEKAVLLLVGDLSTFEKPIATLGKPQEIRLTDYSAAE